MSHHVMKLALVICISLVAAEVSAELRTWTSANGLFTREAEMIRLEGDMLYLRKPDTGIIFPVKLDEFSQDDQKFARQKASQAVDQSTNSRGNSLNLISDQGPTGAIDFNKIPRPDYLSLLKMYYAANKDILKDNQTFLAEVYAVLAKPSLNQNNYSSAFAKTLTGSKELNEFTRPKALKTITEQAKKILENSSDWPETAVFRIHWQLELGQYDFDTQRFLFKTFPAYNHTYQDMMFSRSHLLKNIQDLNPRQPECRVPRMPVPRLRPSADVIQKLQLSRQNSHIKFFAPFPIHLFGKNNHYSLLPYHSPFNYMNLVVKGSDQLQSLPMKPDQAEAFLERLPKKPRKNEADRRLPVELLVKVGPVTISEGQVQPIPAQIFAARVLHPQTGQIIHQYKFDLVPQTVAESTRKSSSLKNPYSEQAAPALNRLRRTLLQLKHQPQLMLQEHLEQMAREQIRTEKPYADFLMQMKNNPAASKQKYSQRSLNPKRPLFLYEWQQLHREQAKLAAGPLLELFSGNGQAWSFIKDETDWDDRFNAIVGLLVFSPEKIKDRTPETAAAEMVPTMKQLLTAVAAKSPERMAIHVGLGAMQYDAATNSLVAKENQQSRGISKDRSFVPLEEINNPSFVHPKPQGGVPYPIGIAYPKSVQSSVLYSIRWFGDNQSNQKSDAMSALRKSFENGPGVRAITSFQNNTHRMTHEPAAVALDREIRFSRIPIEQAVAEDLMKSPYWENSLQARIILSQLDTAIATEYVHDRTVRQRGVIQGHVEGIQIKTRKGVIVAFIPAAELPEISQSMQKLKAANSIHSQGLAPRKGPRALTPEFIPLLIARHQPKFFAEHIDQFIVNRLQHEYWYRKEPSRNVYGVNPATGQAFPPVDTVPDVQKRKQLVEPLNDWVTKNSEVIGDHFTLQFDKIGFESTYGEKTPAPAFIDGTVYSTPHSYGGMSHIRSNYSSLEYELTLLGTSSSSNAKKTPEWQELSDRIDVLTRHLSLAPPEIYFSQRRFQFIVTDANGKRSLETNRASMGGNRSGGIAGVPLAKPLSEPIIPVLRVDKEIWVPQNATLKLTKENPLLELTMQIMKVEVVDAPPPHPWIEAMKQYGPKNQKENKIDDKGQYAIMHVALKSAKLVGATTGQTLLPLELKDYRKVEKRKK